MPPDPALVDALGRYFARYTSTIELARELMRSKRAPQEVLLLLVGRLDALASAAGSDASASRERFVSFLSGFGTHRNLLRRVSAGDLYYELGYHRWLLEGMLETPGRIQRFGPVDDPFISFLWESGIPITLRDATRLTTRSIDGLQRTFRVKPKQSLAKPTCGTIDQVVQAIVATHQGRQFARLRTTLPSALANLVRNARLADVLYVRFRSGVIHELSVQINEDRFFTEQTPYWEPWASEYYGGFLHVEFPATFLVDLVETTIEGYRQALLAKGKLPMGILSSVFDETVLDHLALLDEASLPGTEALVPRPRRPR